MAWQSAGTAIIGGGIVGTCTAYFLAQGGEDVLLLERGELCSGTSKQCNGSIVSGMERLSAYACRSKELYVQFAAESEAGFEYHQKGSFRLIGSEAKATHMSAVVERQRQEGMTARLISPEELKQCEPNIDISRILAAVDYPGDAEVNPYLAVRVIAKAASRVGTRILPRTEVRGAQWNPTRRLFEIMTSGGTVEATRLVIAAGVWTGPIGEMLGIRIPVSPLRGQVIVTGNSEPLVNRKINETESLKTTVRNADREVELLVTSVIEPTPHNNYLIGRSEERVGYENRTTTSVLRELCTRAASYIPALRTLDIIRSYAGLRPVTPDGLPIISAVAEMPGLFVAAGHGGNGITLGPITGLLLSEMILGKSLSLPIALFDLNRFRPTSQERT